MSRLDLAAVGYFLYVSLDISKSRCSSFPPGVHLLLFASKEKFPFSVSDADVKEETTRGQYEDRFESRERRIYKKVTVAKKNDRVRVPNSERGALIRNA